MGRPTWIEGMPAFCRWFNERSDALCYIDNDWGNMSALISVVVKNGPGFGSSIYVDCSAVFRSIATGSMQMIWAHTLRSLLLQSIHLHPQNVRLVLSVLKQEAEPLGKSLDRIFWDAITPERIPNLNAMMAALAAVNPGKPSDTFFFLSSVNLLGSDKHMKHLAKWLLKVVQAMILSTEPRFLRKPYFKNFLRISWEEEALCKTFQRLEKPMLTCLVDCIRQLGFPEWDYR